MCMPRKACLDLYVDLTIKNNLKKERKKRKCNNFYRKSSTPSTSSHKDQFQLRKNNSFKWGKEEKQFTCKRPIAGCCVFSGNLCLAECSLFSVWLRGLICLYSITILVFYMHFHTDRQARTMALHILEYWLE